MGNSREYLPQVVVAITVTNEAYLVEGEVQALKETVGAVDIAPSEPIAEQSVSTEPARSADSAQGNLFTDKSETVATPTEDVPAKPKRRRTTSGTTRKRVKREKE